MAIHDAHYATRPESWTDLWWRLQYISEMRVGVGVRKQAAREDSSIEAAKEAFG